MTTRYLLMLHEDESIWDDLNDDERAAYLGRHEAFDTRLAAEGITFVAGEALKPVATAKTFRRRGDDVTITDGPFAELTEQFGGFYLVDAPDLDAVLRALPELPEYTVEIRPTGLA